MYALLEKNYKSEKKNSRLLVILIILIFNVLLIKPQNCVYLQQKHMYILDNLFYTLIYLLQNYEPLLLGIVQTRPITIVTN